MRVTSRQQSTGKRLMERTTEPKPQGCCGPPIREELEGGQAPTCLRRPRLIRQRRSVETGVEANSIANIGPGANDRVLLTAAQRGHPTAFGDLVEGHAGCLRHMAFRITRNREDAEDAVQDCFKNAFVHFNSFRGQSRFSTWLVRIAMNCALMKVRARRDLIPLDDSIESCVSVEHRRVRPSSLTPEENYRRKELQSILAEQIARLQPKLRSALLLHLREGLMAREAAEVLGISPCALKARVHRARLELRFQLERLCICKNPSMHNRQVGCNCFSRSQGSSSSFTPNDRNVVF